MELLTLSNADESLPVFPNGLRKLKTKYSSWESYYTQIYNACIKNATNEEFFTLTDHHHSASHFSLASDAMTILSSRGIGKGTSSNVLKLMLKLAQVLLNVLLSVMQKKRSKNDKNPLLE
ncbi:BA75_02142T0 [Komagataella pastoris]|uniref:BA75_02142T0 n=1 Tax=Komagataella pastoris TaxID=4922 RepID=A0A1B2JAN5_PICPA|nr:BA75_02142T0 [Komagataella pastoris]